MNRRRQRRRRLFLLNNISFSEYLTSILTCEKKNFEKILKNTGDMAKSIFVEKMQKNSPNTVPFSNIFHDLPRVCTLTVSMDIWLTLTVSRDIWLILKLSRDTWLTLTLSRDIWLTLTLTRNIQKAS